MSAALIAGSAALALAAEVPQLGAAHVAPEAVGRADLTVHVSGLRSDKGVLQYCVSPAGAAFPECLGAGVVSGSEAISHQAAVFTVRGLRTGDYAVAVYHDQNSSKRLDTLIGIPREGYGFSRNPAFKPRAPRFDEAAISLNRNTDITIRMRYLF
jgi:uncharacterized protein (DUF2141 family)